VSRNGTPVIHREDAIARSSYQQSLDAGTKPPELRPSDVRFWSDFSRVFFHPRSVVQLYDYELNSSLMPFENWSFGSELFGSLDKEHDLLDRDVRPFVEEADQMQGIQVFTSIDDAWGGFAAAYLERLRDEYGKSCLWTWGVQRSLSGAKKVRPLVHSTHAITDPWTLGATSGSLWKHSEITSRAICTIVDASSSNIAIHRVAFHIPSGQELAMACFGPSGNGSGNCKSTI
jgi:hypothetical protein